MSVRHPLAVVLADAAAGTFPVADGRTDVFPPDRDGTCAVVALTGHAYVLAEVPSAEVRARVTDGTGGGFGGVGDPSLLSWLAGTARHVGTVDVVLAHVGPGESTEPAAMLERRHDLAEHPRVVRALSHRRDVQVYGGEHGLITVGRGLVDRWELSVEVFGRGADGLGAGRRLIAAGLRLGPADEPCWAQVAAGNARSMRAFLAAGFVPIGSEVLITPS